MTRAVPAAMLGRTMLSIFAFAVGACGGPKYVYAPARPEVDADGQVFTRIPVDEARGEVRVSWHGVRRVSSSTGAQVDALLVRMIVTNDSTVEPWTIDTRQQLLQLPTGFRAEPLLASSPGADGTMVTVGCRDRRVVDLYYVMPPAGLVSMPSFDLLWQVKTGRQLVSKRTEFDRVRVTSYVEPMYASTEPGAEWGFWPDRPIVVLRDSDAVVAERELRRDELR